MMPLPAEVFLGGQRTHSLRANSCSLMLLSLYKTCLRIVGEEVPFTFFFSRKDNLLYCEECKFDII